MNHLITWCPYLALTKITVSILALLPQGFSDGVLCVYVSVQKPLAHKWGKAVTTSRRFCNVCRRKADPSILLSCQGEERLIKSFIHACIHSMQLLLTQKLQDVCDGELQGDFAVHRCSGGICGLFNICV